MYIFIKLKIKPFISFIKNPIMKFKNNFILSLFALFIFSSTVKSQDVWPDGTKIDKWFKENKPTDINKLGKKYILTANGMKNDSTILQTKELQAIIDLAAKNGGGVVVVLKGTFLISSVFFKQGTHLHLENGAKLKGSDDINDFFKFGYFVVFDVPEIPKRIYHFSDSHFHPVFFIQIPHQIYGLC